MSIRVVARIRPQQKNELSKDIIVSSAHHHHHHPNSKQKNEPNGRPDIVKIPNPKNEAESFAFQFSSVYDCEATQQEIFEQEVAPTIKPLFSGLDVTIFAYGSTGTGKTHTMRGGKTLADRGIIPRLLSSIYRRARKIEKDSGGQSKVDITLSYYEIYNDKVFDLLEPPEQRAAAGLPIRDNGGKTVVVGLVEKTCDNLKEFEILYDKANINRSTGATKLNATSSRSHAILAIKVAITSEGFVKTSTVSAIDLAGSEDNRRTENGKERMVESAAINRSLFTLAKCVEAISQNQTRIPYRESKMTRILSLGQNNGMTIMILNLAPIRSFHLDTLSSLNFANRTKKIEVREIENEPIFKGCVRAVPSLTGEAVKRQPLRPLTNAAHNSTVNTSCTTTDPSLKPRAFAVYADKSCSSNPARKQNFHRSSPHSQRDTRTLSNGRSNDLRNLPRSMPVPESTWSKQAIEDMVERKVANILASRALDQPHVPVEPEISQEVQKRLDMLERKIEGQQGTGREQGLTFLLCAKQHAVRGEDRSALRMYELARPFFPENPKLQHKIEKLQQKTRLPCPDDGPVKMSPADKVHTKKARKASDPDSDYQDVQEHDDDHDYCHDADLVPPLKKRRRQDRDTSRQPCSSWTAQAENSPGTRRLFDIIASRDVTQISQLKGVGMKRAEGIVDALHTLHEGSISSLAQLAQLRGVGVKTVENMRNGLRAPAAG